MNQADFDKLYKKGQDHRRKYSKDSATCSLAAFFARTQDHPPVIGFGLPTAQLPHSLVVTVGINPSTEEFEGRPPPLPTVDDSSIQWTAQTRYFVPSAANSPNEGWFALAGRFLLASGVAPATGTQPCSPYSDGLAVHLDLSPLVTSAFTRTFSDEVDCARMAGDSMRAELIKKSAREMLSDGLREILSPTLAAIRKVNDLSVVVVFGCSLWGGGTPLVNEVLRGRLESKMEPKLVGDAKVGRAAARKINISVLPQHLRSIALQHGDDPGFSSLPIVLVSQGPSYWRRENTPDSTIDEIGKACAELLQSQQQAEQPRQDRSR